MEMSAALPQIYELEYRLTSSSEGLLVIVGEDSPLAIEGLDDAARYKVHSNSLRVLTYSKKYIWDLECVCTLHANISSPILVKRQNVKKTKS